MIGRARGRPAWGGAAIILTLGVASGAPDAPDAPDDGAVERMIVQGRVVAETTPLTVRAALGAEEIAAAAPMSLADLGALLPSVQLRTNSRGESLAFIRGAGERETALFLDGAPLNTPWDNRIDLDLLPAGLVAEASVLSGPIAARYGARASGGAIEFTSFAALETSGRLRAEGGSGGARRVDLLAAGEDAGVAWTAAFERRARAALPLADAGLLPFSQIDGDRRTNTDLAAVAGYARASRAFGETLLSASFLIAEARQGVAPESDRDPALARVRFWRLPENDLRLASLTLDHRHGRGARTQARGWWSAYDQTIDVFEDAAFDAREARLSEDNATFGGRLVHGRPVGSRVDVDLSASGHVSTHDEREEAFDGFAPGPPVRDERFREALLVVGAEASASPAPHLDIALSASLDRFAVLEKGGFEEAPGPFTDVSFGLGATWRPSTRWTLRAAAGRRPRQPTLRELFGSGAGRFLPNPALVSERTWAGEAGAAWRAAASGAALRLLRATAFVRRTQDALDQRGVTLDGEVFQERFNRPGARVLGVEALGEGAFLDERLTWRAQLTWQRVRGEEGERLPERPRLTAFAALGYAPPSGLGLRVELARTGFAVSPDGFGELRPVATATTVNLEASWTFAPIAPRDGTVRLYVRADNVTDAFVEPQAGLPKAGRIIRGGLIAAF